MPTAADLFQRLSGDRVFSKIDPSKGYWQVPSKKRILQRLVFVLSDETYEFLCMSFGMKNSCATLKRDMEKNTK